MSSSHRLICLDHAATTALDPQVLEAMLPSLRGACGNPSSTHRFGREALAAVQAARATVADILGAKPEEIFFTSGGTESDNLALRGVALASPGSGRHLITLSVEHHAITHTCEALARGFGCRVTYLPVDRFGRVNPEDVDRAVTHDTALISVMYANNEVGTIEPIEEIARIARARRIPFHTDAVQAVGVLPLNVNRLGVDLLSLSAHKFHGPKGVGVLYVREGTRIAPTQTGGGQERGLRAGTENVPGIVGLAAALQLAHARATGESQRLAGLRDLLIKGITSAIPQCQLTGHPTQRLAGSASFVFAGVKSADLLLELDAAGVAASGGSACASCNSSPSQVLTAMGFGHDLARGALRLTLGAENTDEDVRYLLGVLPGIVARLRSGSAARVTASSIQLESPLSGPHATHDSPDSPSPGWTPRAFGMGTGIAASGYSQASPSSLVYAIGMVGYDFGTETRRDSLLQQSGKDVRVPAQLLLHLKANPSAAAGVIWTLGIEGVPVYAIAPSGPFADTTYERLRQFLLAQSTGAAERISMPGVIGGSVTLLNGRRVPVIVPEVRGLSAWSTKSLALSVLGRPSRTKASARKLEEIGNFLDRIYYELRNLGVAPQERAINFAATTAHQAGRIFQDTITAGLKLDDISVERNPICRPGSDCWDVKLTFFNPLKRLQEGRKVYRMSVDVSDVVPVTIGKTRGWEVY